MAHEEPTVPRAPRPSRSSAAASWAAGSGRPTPATPSPRWLPPGQRRRACRPDRPLAGDHDLPGDVAGHCSMPARWKN